MTGLPVVVRPCGVSNAGLNLQFVSEIQSGDTVFDPLHLVTVYAEREDMFDLTNDPDSYLRTTRSDGLLKVSHKLTVDGFSALKFRKHAGVLVNHIAGGGKLDNFFAQHTGQKLESNCQYILGNVTTGAKPGYYCKEPEVANVYLLSRTHVKPGSYAFVED